MQNNKLTSRKFTVNDVLKDWHINTESHIANFMRSVAGITFSKEILKEITFAGISLGYAIDFYEEEFYEYPDDFTDPDSFKTQICPRELIRDWSLPLYLNTAIEYLYKSRFVSGKLYLYYLYKALSFTYRSERFYKKQIRNHKCDNKNANRKRFSIEYVQRPRKYKLESVLSNWGIDPDHPLARVLTRISYTNVYREDQKDLHEAGSILSSHIEASEESEFLIGCSSCAELLYSPEHPIIKPVDLSEDWDLPYHQGRALEHIYDAVNHRPEYLDHLRKAERIIDSRIYYLIFIR